MPRPSRSAPPTGTCPSTPAAAGGCGAHGGPFAAADGHDAPVRPGTLNPQNRRSLMVKRKRKAKAKPPAAKVAASVVIHRAGDMTPQGRKDVANWLRRQA